MDTETTESMETTKQYSGFPRISTFSGSAKGETNYEFWRYEIQCLVSEKVYREDQILQAIRRSVKGEAANVLMRLGTSASIDEIIHKMNSIYDTIDSGQRILGQFYSAEQEENETVSQWGCRLEQLINKAVLRGEVEKSNVDEMLRHAFWEGIRPNLKDVSGYIFDKHLTFDELRSELRSIEQDQERRKKHNTKGRKENDTGLVMSVTNDEQTDSSMEEIRGMLHKLTVDVQQLKDERQARPQQNFNRENFNKYRSSFQQNTTQTQYFQPNNGTSTMNYQPRQPFLGSFQYRGQRSSTRGYRGGYNNQRQGTGRGVFGQNGLPVCYRCGQEGHVQSGCRVRTDHLRQNLNSMGPASRGRP